MVHGGEHLYQPHTSYAFALSRRENPRELARGMACRTAFQYRGSSDQQNSTHVHYVKPSAPEVYAYCRQAVTCGVGRDGPLAREAVPFEQRSCMLEIGEHWQTSTHLDHARVHDTLACARHASSCEEVRACAAQSKAAPVAAAISVSGQMPNGVSETSISERILRAVSPASFP